MIRTAVLVVAILSNLPAAPQTNLDEDLEAAHKAESSRDFAAAEAAYERALQTHPSADTYQRLGLVRHLQNKFSQASSAFSSALKLNPNLWSSQLFLGIDLYRLNRFSEALPHFRKADRLNPGQEETEFWLGATLIALKDYFEGFSALEGVLEKNPANTEALRVLAENYADYGTQLLNQVAERAPDTAAGLEVQGKAFEFEGSYGEALKAYLRAQAKDPNLPGIRESIERVTNLQHK